MDKLENTKGFLDVNHKKAEIEGNLRSIAEEKINEHNLYLMNLKNFQIFNNNNKKINLFLLLLKLLKT